LSCEEPLAGFCLLLQSVQKAASLTFKNVVPYLYTAEGFRLTGRPFVVPEELETLDASQKRMITICNVFANHKQSIAEIAKVLDIRPFTVVSALIEGGLIEERRHYSQPVTIDKRGQTRYHAECEQFRFRSS
jgi:hypothetical protein